jgi:hypothetical protein
MVIGLDLWFRPGFGDAATDRQLQTVNPRLL